MTARIDHLVTSGTFSLDGGTWDVDNNVWLVGDDDECVVIDAAARRRRDPAAVGRRHLRAIVCTHAHDDHVNVGTGRRRGDRRADPAAPRRSGALGPGASRTRARQLPRRRHDDRGRRHRAAGAAHARPRARRGVPLRARRSAWCSAATPCSGGPGATGRSYSDFATIIESIRTKLLTPAAATPSCTPVTATTRRSAPRRRTSTSGSRGS